MPTDLVGYRALGRYGDLGVVVDVQENGGGLDDTVVVVRGGISEALTFFVPAARVLALSPDRRTVELDIDLTDFVPNLSSDGTVELRAAT